MRQDEAECRQNVRISFLFLKNSIEKIKKAGTNKKSHL
jgi:hypothetical protein